MILSISLLNGLKSGEADFLKKRVEEVSTKLRNLMNRLEDAESDSEVTEIRKRIRERTEEKKQLEDRLVRIGSSNVGVGEASSVGHSVAQFFRDFNHTFLKGSLVTKKLLLRRLIKQIVVDREQNVIRVYACKIPAVHDRIAELQDFAWNKKAAHRENERLECNDGVAGAR